MYLKFLHRAPSLIQELTKQVVPQLHGAVRKEVINRQVTKSVISDSTKTKENYTPEEANLKPQKKNVLWGKKERIHLPRTVILMHGDKMILLTY